MGNITEIIEESIVQLEIIEPEGGQIEVVDNSTKLEIVESGSSLNPTTLDIAPQINTIVVDSINESTTIDISINEPTTVETTIVTTAIDIVEDQVVYQTGSIFNNLFFPVTSSITNNFITQSITQSITQNITQSITESQFITQQFEGDNIINGGFLVEEGGTFSPQFITQSGNDFTPSQIEDLLDLIYSNGTVNISASPTSGLEKTKAENINFTFSVTLNDDTISTAIFDSLDVTSNPNGSQLYENITSTISKTYKVTFTKDSRVVNKSATATFRDPQYLGVSSIENFNGSTYSNLNSNLTKKLQSGTGMSQALPPGTVTDEFVYFLTKNSNATITDQNGFNNTNDFNKTTITVEFFDGSSQTLTQYRTKNTKTFIEPITYTIT